MKKKRKDAGGKETIKTARNRDSVVSNRMMAVKEKADVRGKVNKAEDLTAN